MPDDSAATSRYGKFRLNSFATERSRQSARTVNKSESSFLAG